MPATENPLPLAVAAADAAALLELFGRAGASNGCWCRYWLLGPAYHRRDRQHNREDMVAELLGAAAPAPGMIATAPDGTPVGWARLSPRAELGWLRRRFGERLPPGRGGWALPCFFVRPRFRRRGVMTALVEAAVAVCAAHRVPWVEAYPIDPAVAGATRNRFPGVLSTFRDAGFTEVGRLAPDRAVVRIEPADRG